MPRLLATNFSNVGYDELEKEYGTTVEVLTTGFIDIANPAGIKRIHDKVMPIIKSASPEDFLVISGAAGISIIISHLWIRYHGVLKMLTFNRRVNGGRYVEVVYPGVEISPDDNQSGQG